MRGASLFSALLCLAPFPVPFVAALPGEVARDTGVLPVHVVHRFPLGTWVENLAFRQSKSSILATTLLPLPQLYEVNPQTSKASLVHEFAHITSLTGISELGADVFYVIGGNYSIKTLTSQTGSWSVWKVDLTGNAPAVSELANFPRASFLNGMTVLKDDIILLADSALGAVWSCNVHTKSVAMVIQDPTMKNGSLGINGIKVLDGYLYYTNSGSMTFAKIPIDPSKGTATGPAVVISSGVPGDDFTFDKKGNAWVAANFINQLLFLPNAATGKPGSVMAIVEAGSINSTSLAGVTAAEVGPKGKLYVSTSGGLQQYLTGKFTVGGMVGSV